MRSYSVKEIFDIISDGAYKKDMVEITGVSNDKLTRLLDPNNGGKLFDLIQALNSFGCGLNVTHGGEVMPVKLKADHDGM